LYLENLKKNREENKLRHEDKVGQKKARKDMKRVFMKEELSNDGDDVEEEDADEKYYK
jgi:hypothetical protein